MSGKPGHRGPPLVRLCRITSHYAAANYRYDDSSTTADGFCARSAAPLTAEIRAVTVWRTSGPQLVHRMTTIADQLGEVKHCRPPIPAMSNGSPGSRVDQRRRDGYGRGTASASRSGVQGPTKNSQQHAKPGRVVCNNHKRPHRTSPGSIITIQVSNGIPRLRPSAAAKVRHAGRITGGEIPGMPPITIP